MGRMTCTILDDIINPKNMFAKGPSFHPSKVPNFIVWKCELRVLFGGDTIHCTLYH
jgi:hypothetical protein